MKVFFFLIVLDGFGYSERMTWL